MMYHLAIWMFPKIGVPQDGWFIMKNPIKMDDLGGKPTIFGNTHLYNLMVNDLQLKNFPRYHRCFEYWRILSHIGVSHFKSKRT